MSHGNHFLNASFLFQKTCTTNVKHIFSKQTGSHENALSLKHQLPKPFGHKYIFWMKGKYMKKGKVSHLFALFFMMSYNAVWGDQTSSTSRVASLKSTCFASLWSSNHRNCVVLPRKVTWSLSKDLVIFVCSVLLVLRRFCILGPNQWGPSFYFCILCFCFLVILKQQLICGCVFYLKTRIKTL